MRNAILVIALSLIQTAGRAQASDIRTKLKAPASLCGEPCLAARSDSNLVLAGYGIYGTWLTEDARYIITDPERAAFKMLKSDEERGNFIASFWRRRDPTPDTFENEFEDEHYRRMIYANERFASSVPGWRSDRGRIYIMYGPPDSIESTTFGELNGSAKVNGLAKVPRKCGDIATFPGMCEGHRPGRTSKCDYRGAYSGSVATLRSEVLFELWESPYSQ